MQIKHFPPIAIAALPHLPKSSSFSADSFWTPRNASRDSRSSRLGCGRRSLHHGFGTCTCSWVLPGTGGGVNVGVNVSFWGRGGQRLVTRDVLLGLLGSKLPGLGAARASGAVLQRRKGALNSLDIVMEVASKGPCPLP